MARARFQEGTLSIEGKGPKAHYFTRFRVYDLEGGSKRKQITIGLVSKMSKREANKRRAEIIAEQTSQLPRVLAAQKGEMTFETFYKERFLVMKTVWSEPHRESFSYIMDRFVLPKFGTLAIGTIDKVQVQGRLNSLTAGYSQSTIKHVRTKLVEVFEEALEQEFINRNPASRTNIPSVAREPERPILTEAQLIGIIDRLTDSKDKAIFLTGTFCAMRTSEIFGLPWRNFHQGDEQSKSFFMVNQIAYRVSDTTGRRMTRVNLECQSELARLRRSSSGRRKVQTLRPTLLSSNPLTRTDGARKVSLCVPVSGFRRRFTPSRKSSKCLSR